MISFFNAGYKKEEIEEAAQFLMSKGEAQPMKSTPTQTQQTISNPVPKKKQSMLTKLFSSQKKTPEKTPNIPIAQNNSQKVSDYGNKKQNKKLLFISIIATVVILIGIFILIFFLL